MSRFLSKNTNLVKLIIFVVFTSITSLFVLITVDNSVGQATDSYKATFSDAFGLQVGDDVRIAGVRVGRIDATTVDKDGHALVKMSIAKDVTVRDSTSALIRYRDLLGRRYLALQDSERDGAVLKPGTTIPIERTAPALDLTVLFNGFRPVFETLNPGDVNKLAAQIISTFQGEGGTVDQLLESTASLTTTLASRDQTIGRVITNLDSVLGTVAKRDQALSQLIVNLKDLAGGLSGDRDVIGDSLAHIDDFVAAANNVITKSRPDITSSIKSLNTVVGVVEDNKKVLDAALKKLPAPLAALVRGTSYGSWLNLYLCDLQLLLPTGGQVDLDLGVEKSPRCTQ